MKPGDSDKRWICDSTIAQYHHIAAKSCTYTYWDDGHFDDVFTYEIFVHLNAKFSISVSSPIFDKQDTLGYYLPGYTIYNVTVHQNIFHQCPVLHWIHPSSCDSS